MFKEVVDAIKGSVFIESFKGKDGETLYSKQLYREPVNELAQYITVHTLEGVADYINQSIDEVATEIFVQVLSHNEVRVYRYLDDRNHRECLVRATYQSPGFSFGASYAPDEFVTALLTSFEDTGSREQIQKFVGGLTVESRKVFQDDGISQSTVVKEGLQGHQRANVPSPIVLRPYRTFSEIKEQPESKFILRLATRADKTPTVSLHEADNAHWKVEAIGQIRDHLRGLVKVPVLG